MGNITLIWHGKEKMAKVDVVKVNSSKEWTPSIHHAVEEEVTEKILFTSDTQNKQSIGPIATSMK